MFLALKYLPDTFRLIGNVEFVKVDEEVGLFIYVVGDVIVGVVHIILQNIDVQFVELGVAGFIFLAFLEK